MSMPECNRENDQPAHTWTLTIHGRIPMSMNQRERCSYWKRHKELQQLTEDLKYLAAEQKIPRATTRRSVRVTIHKSMRSRVKDDPANRDSRAKSVLDALAKLGLLIDDNDTHLNWQGVTEGKREPIPATVITISE